MTSTAEYVATDGGFSRAAVDDMTMLRYEQYLRAIADDRSFQRRYMQPIVLRGKKGVSREIGARSIAELVQTLIIHGGGFGLFTGCAAGDTGAALVVHVGD